MCLMPFLVVNNMSLPVKDGPLSATNIKGNLWYGNDILRNQTVEDV